MFTKYGIVCVLVAAIVDAIQLYQEEMTVGGISHGAPELAIQKEIARLAKDYDMQGLNKLLHNYPRFARKLRKMEKVYLDRLHSLSPNEVKFFLEAYPDFLLSYVVRPIKEEEETAKSFYVCKDWTELSKAAQKNLMKKFPFRGKSLEKQCE